ncbi:MAG TPA: NAD(P)H-hydrate epimerase, partial [Longimicrobiaceae bacterium]|nr:NAD(P)H-hydrate epimerase [Longimicrobiaceae bacterium]
MQIETVSRPAGSDPAGRLFGVRDVALLGAAEMRAWDERAIRTLGIGERVLMERAGTAAARVVDRLYPTGRVVAAVGAGNNGGDAVVLLRVLRAWGRDVCAVSVGDAPLPLELLHGWQIEVAPAERAGSVLATASVVIDGILGTGARGAPRPPHAALIEQLTRAGAPVVALDGPSGVDLTGGTIAGAAVRAEVTVTFGAPKRGLLLYPGRAHAGRIV